MYDYRFADDCLALSDSSTHGMKAHIAEINQKRGADVQVLDLSIGSLDDPADERIDKAVADFILSDAKTIHDFSPVKGFPSLLEMLAARIKRISGVTVDPSREVIVTGGGIKGSLTACFHAFLNPGDEVLIPIPNWPHYSDMVRLHRAVPRFVLPSCSPLCGLTASDLERNVTSMTKIVVLNDLVNPTGKIYSSEELRQIAQVIAIINVRRLAERKSPLQVIFDCPYEAHVLGGRAITFAAIETRVPGYGSYSMRRCTATLTGPGKTYGMHGDRVGYIWADQDAIAMLARVQVNTTSFASTYAQMALCSAVREDLDQVAEQRAVQARLNLQAVLDKLICIPGLKISPPEGGYFLFVDLSWYAGLFADVGYTHAVQFLLHQAGVAGVGGSSFAPGVPALEQFVRLNCGRSINVLLEACARISGCLAALRNFFVC